MAVVGLLCLEVAPSWSRNAPPPQCFLPWAREILSLEMTHRPTKQEDIRKRIHCTFISHSLWVLRCNPKKQFECRNLNRTVEAVQATLHSANSLNTALHHGLILNTVYIIFNHFYAQRCTDDAILQRKTWTRMEATVSIIYCTVEMGHRFLWSACISVTNPRLHNVN